MTPRRINMNSSARFVKMRRQSPSMTNCVYSSILCWLR
ncbi:hypothetical protein L914_06046 [Phytophthora nicotianae]|uniref:Uncharacterized protein n=1 Tax=Phytophthora nicotianae TaxID=4792 RepID=W2NQ25_PHYNI|nr:hypothetical protein L914_06046 [Phytophthora nicotianae]